MLIVKISPGLANQMYEYVAAYALAKELGQELVLDISECINSTRGYLLDYFRIPDSRKLIYTQVSVEAESHLNCDSILQLMDERGKSFAILVEKEETKRRYAAIDNVMVYTGLDMADRLGEYEHIYVCGYFSDRNLYYKKYWCEAIEFFKLKEENSDIHCFKELIDGKTSVGVHIRRGDMLLADWAVPLEDEYYRAAIQYSRKLLGNCIYCVFSDDINYAKKILGTNDDIYYIHFSGYNDAAINEFICLSLCDHRILSNSSTYGRLADDLNWGKERHVFSKYTGGFEEPKSLAQCCTGREIYLNQWDIKKYGDEYSVNCCADTQPDDGHYHKFSELIKSNKNHEALQIAFCTYFQNIEVPNFADLLAEALIRTGFYEEGIVELAHKQNRIGGGAEKFGGMLLDRNRKYDLKELFDNLTKIHNKHFLIVFKEPAAAARRIYGLLGLGIVLAHLGHIVTLIYAPRAKQDEYYLQSSRLYNKEGIDMGCFHYNKDNILAQGVEQFYESLGSEELCIISRDERFFKRVKKKTIFITTDLSDDKDGEIKALVGDSQNLSSLYRKADMILTKNKNMAQREKYIYWKDRGMQERFWFVESQWKYGYQQRMDKRMIGMAEAICQRLGEDAKNVLL